MRRTFLIAESAELLKTLSVILGERLPAAARHFFHDRYLLVDVLSTLLSIKAHYSLTRHAKDAALFFNSINSRRAALHLHFEGSV